MKSNISVFVPHIGCKNMCSFCNQKMISGTLSTIPTENEIWLSCKKAVSNEKLDPSDTEIAFFGGSFSAIEKKLMMDLLKYAGKCVEYFGFKGVRCSTRPDAINEDILEIFKKYHVTSVELGAQSMDDEILEINHRGHSAEDVFNASKLIKHYGFSLGLQMMIGLYGDTFDKTMDTTEKIISINPDTIRIYPAIILKNTLLEKLFVEKKYRPLSLEDAIDICCEIIERITHTNIKIIRLGLHASKSLEENMVAGPYHPAFCELCKSEILLKKICAELKQKNITNDNITILSHPSDISKIIGHNKKNINFLKKMGYNVTVKASDNLPLKNNFKICT